MSKRKVFNVEPNKKADTWEITSGGSTLDSFDRKQDAIQRGIERARGAGGDSQLRIRKSDGTIQEERTYGHDPERYPG